MSGTEYTEAARKRSAGRAALLLLLPSLIASCAPQPGEFTTEVVDTQKAASPETQSLLRVADAAKANGDNADAAELYQRLLKEHPEVLKARTSLGQAELDKGDPALAWRQF